MGADYLPRGPGADPSRAVRLLLRWLLYLSLIGLVWAFLFKKRG